MREIKLLQHNCEMIFTDGSITDRDRKLASLCKNLATTYTSCALITDRTVHSLYGKLITGFLQEAGLAHCEIILPPGESTKTLLSANTCWNEMISHQMDRKSCVLAVGGGVTTDLAGFAAACYMRGIDVIHIPTTLIGMVDAAIGGKAGINLHQGKNLVGCFHHPKKIFICPSFLKTLPEREYRAGLAEVIKYGVIDNGELFNYLENHISSILQKSEDLITVIIQRCCQIKIQIVDEDPEDVSGVRAVLNWGHTFAHAIESITHYKSYLHGEAVAIGMSCAAAVSEKLGYAERDFAKRQDNLIKEAGLPLSLPEIPIDELLKAMVTDKKSQRGKISLIVANNIGKVFPIQDVDKQNIKKALARTSHTLSSEGGQDVASNSLSYAREHCQTDKARAFESGDGVTDCPDSQRECEKCRLTKKR